ncbi:winged helix-turn-helix transcriptional regulator [Brevibacterium marinum]|uniref:winged helix-turn-helix transcriptional regulator n=1 Tax=Brevibacterium marinum TaxID=418643 RepID=UPI00143923AD|nr:helix-turn-helix domain-containing protein [Brevibacterium marinum]
MLTLRLLVIDGLVTREAVADVPPRVEYARTELGRSLQEPVAALRRWAVTKCLSHRGQPGPSNAEPVGVRDPDCEGKSGSPQKDISWSRSPRAPRSVHAAHLRRGTCAASPSEPNCS